MIQNRNFLGAPGSITTERLFGTQPTADDLPNFRTLDSNLAVQRTLFGKTYTHEESQKRLAKFMCHWSDHRFGEWMFRLGDGTFVGTAGLFYDVIDDEEVIALGYVLDEPYWGRGFATEMAHASIRVAFDALKVANVYGVIDPVNVPSRHVLEKSGFAYVKDFLYHGEWESALFRAPASN
ncbi:MAG TPA: GNAT family N-acetyltransferase [Candidatus Baltobacteraceae bacterium]|jgi:RimJ/RimL family protein N-acetyltransferase